MNFLGECAAAEVADLPSTANAPPVAVKQASGVASTLAFGTVAMLSRFLATMVVLFFMLAAGDRLLRGLIEVLPRFSNKRQAATIATEQPVLGPNVGRSPAAMQAHPRAFQTGATQISDVGIGMLTREYVISVNFPISREGQPRYLLAVVFSPRVFTKLMGGLPADWLAAVIDGNGNYAARSLNNDELIGQPAGEGWRAVMRQTGIFEFPSREGVPLIQATISSPRLGWASGVAMSRTALYAPLWKRAAISGLVAAIAVILCLAIVIGLGRRINSSLRLLERAVGNLRRQKPTVERTGEREIDSVIAAFNLTAAEISAHEQERAAHERQMRVAAREVTHRSKNLLAVTTAIAGLLSRDAPDAKTFSPSYIIHQDRV